MFFFFFIEFSFFSPILSLFFSRAFFFIFFSLVLSFLCPFFFLLPFLSLSLPTPSANVTRNLMQIFLSCCAFALVSFRLFCFVLSCFSLIFSCQCSASRAPFMRACRAAVRGLALVGYLSASSRPCAIVSCYCVLNVRSKSNNVPAPLRRGCGRRDVRGQ